MASSLSYQEQRKEEEEEDRSQAQPNIRTHFSLPSLPLFSLPCLPPSGKKLLHQGFLNSNLAPYLHSAISAAAFQFRRSAHDALLGIVQSNPHLLRGLLPLPCLPTEVRGLVRRQHSFLAGHNFAAVLPGDSIATVVVSNGIFNFLNIYNTLLIARLILTWFPNSPPIIVNPLSTICDPYLNIFRGLIPPLGGSLDFSPILAFVVLNAVTNTAAALPAELPTGTTSEKCLDSTMTAAPKSTWFQKAWLKRKLFEHQSQKRDD